MKKLYFIINPKAGNGKAMNVWTEVEKELNSQNIFFSHFLTERNGHAIEIANQIVQYASEEEIIKIVIIGGDGTVNEVVNGIAQNLSKVQIGYIPGGSGNDFSRGFGIPKDSQKALSFLLNQLKSEPLPFDLGKIQLEGNKEHYFMSSAGAGFDAFISYKANQSKWKGIFNRFSLGQLVYVYILIKYLFSYKCTTVELTIDGKKQTFPNTWFVTVSNQAYYGGGMKIAPSAIPSDGKLNVTIVSNLSRLKLLLIFLSVFWGKHLVFKEVHTFLAQSTTINSNEPIYVHADGEHIGTTPLHITINSEPLSILTKG